MDDLFAQVLVLCANAGLVKLGRVALDGTKLDASASSHTPMSYGRLVKRIPEVEAEVAKLLAEAEAIDAAEDAEFGVDRRGDELPVELATREARLVKMREAKAAIEAEAAERAAAQAAEKARQGLKTYFEFYNHKRRHQSLDRRTPNVVYCSTLPQKWVAYEQAAYHL
jgi:hypothetical protein